MRAKATTSEAEGKRPTLRNSGVQWLAPEAPLPLTPVGGEAALAQLFIKGGQSLYGLCIRAGVEMPPASSATAQWRRFLVGKHSMHKSTGNIHQPALLTRCAPGGGLPSGTVVRIIRIRGFSLDHSHERNAQFIGETTQAQKIRRLEL